MAVVKFSGLVSEVKGKLNGSCFQGFREKTVLRNKPIKRVVNNNSSINVRSINKQLSIMWRGLTAQQRYSWNTHAGKGLSGYNEFYKRNFFAIMFDTGIIQDCPIDYVEPGTCDFSVEIQSGIINLILETAPLYPDEIVIIKTTPIINGTTDHTNFNMSILIAEASNDGIIDIGTEWTNRFGNVLQVDDRLLIEVVRWNKFSGLTSQPVRKYVNVYEWVFYLDTEISVPCTLCASFQKLISDYSGDCVNVMNYDTENISSFGFVNRVFDYASANTWLNGSAGMIPDVFNQVSGGSLIWQYVKDNMPWFYNGAGAFAYSDDGIRAWSTDKFSCGVAADFSLWCQIYLDNSSGSDYNLIEDSSPSISSAMITISPSNTMISILDSTGQQVYNDGVSISTGVHDLCIIKDGDNYKVYWDNVLKIDDDITGSIFEFDTIFGAPSMGNVYEDMRMNHFFLFNGLLSAADRLALKNNL